MRLRVEASRNRIWMRETSPSGVMSANWIYEPGRWEPVWSGVIVCEGVPSASVRIIRCR